MIAVLGAAGGFVLVLAVAARLCEFGSWADRVATWLEGDA